MTIPPHTKPTHKKRAKQPASSPITITKIITRQEPSPHERKTDIMSPVDYMGQATTPGSDDPRVVDELDAIRRDHLAIHPGCDCNQQIRLSTVANTSAVEDVDGVPHGISTEFTPMVTIIFHPKETA